MNFYVKHSIYILRFINKLQLNQRKGKEIDSVRFQQNFAVSLGWSKRGRKPIQRTISFRCWIWNWN